MRDAHNKAMQDMAATVETKENEHVQAMHDLERKFLTDKGNLQKVRKVNRYRRPTTARLLQPFVSPGVLSSSTSRPPYRRPKCVMQHLQRRGPS